MSSSGNSRNGAHSSKGHIVATDTDRRKRSSAEKPLTKAQKAAIRKKKRQKKIILVVVEILVLLLLAVVLFAVVKLSKIEKDTSFDESDLEFNEGLSSESQQIMKGYTTIALFGLDNRSNGNLSKGNSDVIMIASINNDTHEVKAGICVQRFLSRHRQQHLPEM